MLPRSIWYMSVIPLALAWSVSPVFGQQTLDWPVGEVQPYHKDSGVRSNAGDAARTVYQDVVHVKDAAWLRVYFGAVGLDAGSFIRITSLLDNEVQELDAAGLAMWGNSSAYFNGDTVIVELVAGPRTTRNRLVIDQVAREVAGPLHAPGSCGICGADNRVPSHQHWSGRLFPVGCTASVWNEDSCLVSAGHCIRAELVIQFNVPSSNRDCTTRNPPVADQFPITSQRYRNGGIGADWAVMTCGTNDLGQTPYERYGELRPIASTGPSTGQFLTIWGYGVDWDQCTRSQTQQTSSGKVTSVSNTYFNHDVDATFGNSGSGVIWNGTILGINTHCGDPCPNFATRVDNSDFVNARDELCPCSPPPDCQDTVYVDWNNTGCEEGTPTNPFNTVTEGSNSVCPGGLVDIAAGLYPEEISINRAMTLRATGGSVTIDP